MKRFDLPDDDERVPRLTVLYLERYGPVWELERERCDPRLRREEVAPRRAGAPRRRRRTP